ncbi:hypothetical protein JQK15_12375 [Sphingobium sp. BHU LFT2]|uniref:hypothetical protein n=1 Tax=Sphingobium sp. BHU LFT2 TaxID=2807634 RepID=UPI001BEB3AFD|nr:hypothetical protein [Sphingobium sp. BHU LFT2]MBT2244330.1 hypothetical protein [Sphingobium sp. BHU LFT2]
MKFHSHFSVLKGSQSANGYILVVQGDEADRPLVGTENWRLNGGKGSILNSMHYCELFARTLSALVMPINVPDFICLSRLVQRFMVSLATTEAVTQKAWLGALDIENDPPNANEISARETMRSCWLEETCIPTVTTCPSNFEFRDEAIDG